jgi:hypothetical protein
MSASERVALRLPLAEAVVTWFVTDQQRGMAPQGAGSAAIPRWLGSAPYARIKDSYH